MKLTGFTEVSEILRCGVYILVHRGVVIYVGQSKGMLARIYTHQSRYRDKRKANRPSWLPVKGIQFDEVHVRPCRLEELDALEREYIALYRPKCNQLLKPAGASRVIHVRGLEVHFDARGAQVKLERRV